LAERDNFATGKLMPRNPIKGLINSLERDRGGTARRKLVISVGDVDIRPAQPKGLECQVKHAVKGHARQVSSPQQFGLMQACRRRVEVVVGQKHWAIWRARRQMVRRYPWSIETYISVAPKALYAQRTARFNQVLVVQASALSTAGLTTVP
jgi:hypothetical protein